VTWPKGRRTDTYRADAVDAELAAKDKRIAELDAEVERIDSFSGHLEWLHEHYPADIFTGESGDLGPVTVALSRKLLEAEAEVAVRDRMLDIAADDFSRGEGTEDAYLADLRARTEEGSRDE